MAPDGFDTFAFSYEDTRRDAFRRGKGPGVVIMDEIPGMHPRLRRLPVVSRMRVSPLSSPIFFGEAGRSLSLPFHLSDDPLQEVKQRTSQGGSVLGLRLSEDPMCPPERFESIEIDSSPGHSYSIPKSAHSILTANPLDKSEHPTHEAFDQVVSVFASRLKEVPG
jgi:hypothetical protein